MLEQSVGIKAGAEQQEANNILTQGNYNASLEAFQDHMFRENQAEGFNGSGVLLEGSPMANLQQTKMLADLGVANTQNQALLQSNLTNMEANQTINSGRSQLLGNENQFITGQANADIEQQNVLPKLVGGILGLVAPGVGNLLGGGNVQAPSGNFGSAEAAFSDGSTGGLGGGVGDFIGDSL